MMENFRFRAQEVAVAEMCGLHASVATLHCIYLTCRYSAMNCTLHCRLISTVTTVIKLHLHVGRNWGLSYLAGWAGLDGDGGNVAA